MTNNQELSYGFIENHRDSIDIHAFLDMICKTTGEYIDWNVAISVALNEYRTSLSYNALNQAFIIACEHRSVAILSILREFAYNLTPLTIERALVVCCKFSDILCLDIVKYWARRGPNSKIQLTLTSITIAYWIQANMNASYSDGHVRWKHDCVVRRLVSNHYSSLPNISCLNPECRCQYKYKYESYLSRCSNGDVSRVRAILKEDPERAGEYLSIGALHNSPGTVMLVHDEYRQTIQPADIAEAIDTAINHKHPCVIDLLLALFDSDCIHSAYTNIFNKNCEQGKYERIKLMLTSCNQDPLFGHEFTFDASLVIERPNVMRLLIRAYPEKIQEQFPDWVIEY